MKRIHNVDSFTELLTIWYAFRSVATTFIGVCQYIHECSARRVSIQIKLKLINSKGNLPVKSWMHEGTSAPPPPINFLATVLYALQQQCVKFLHSLVRLLHGVYLFSWSLYVTKLKKIYCDCGLKSTKRMKSFLKTHETLPCACSLKCQFRWTKLKTMQISRVQLLVPGSSFPLMPAGNGALHVINFSNYKWSWLQGLPAQSISHLKMTIVSFSYTRP